MKKFTILISIMLVNYVTHASDKYSDKHHFARRVTAIANTPNTFSGRAINKQRFMNEVRNIINNSALTTEERTRILQEWIKEGGFRQGTRLNMHRTY